MSTNHKLSIYVLTFFVILFLVTFLVTGELRDGLFITVGLATPVIIFFGLVYVFDKPVTTTLFSPNPLIEHIINLANRVFPMKVYAPETELVHQFIATGAVFYVKQSNHAEVSIARAGQANDEWQPCLVATWENYVGIYPKTLLTRQVITFNSRDLRWIGRVQKVTNDRDELSFDVQIEFQWYTVTLRLTDDAMHLFEDEILRLRPENITSARHRRRPNIRCGPIDAYPAGGKLTKIWDSAQSMQLYLTPLWLVILGNDIVIREIALDDISDVQVVDDAQQLTLIVDDETLTFETPEYRSLGVLLTEAIK